MRIAFLLAASATVLLLASPSAAQPSNLKMILKRLGFPDDTVAQVSAGTMVKTDLESSDERELAVGLAFLVKETPKELAEQLREGLLMKVDKNVEAHGALTGEGTLAQFAGLKLGPLTEKYQNAKTDGDLNLSADEVKALQALKGQPASAIEQEVHKQLLARYQAYRSGGLDGIAPYARGSGERSGADELRSATEAARVLNKAAPAFYDTMLNYPKKPATGFRETYNWQLYKAHGDPTVILTHVFVMEDGNSFDALQRQFYVSGGYNVEQAMAGLIPVSGGTLVVYVARSATDQVAGFGGGAKRSMGEKIMASQLAALYTKLAEAAEGR